MSTEDKNPPVEKEDKVEQEKVSAETKTADAAAQTNVDNGVDGPAAEETSQADNSTQEADTLTDAKVGEYPEQYVKGIGVNVKYDLADDVLTPGHTNKGDAPPLAVLNATVDATTSELSTRKESELPGNQEHISKYLQAVEQGWVNAGVSTPILNPFYRSDSVWTNRIEYNGGMLGPGAPSLSKGKSVSRAVLRARAAAGLGTIRRVPLWGSGIWLDIQAPTDGDLFALERAIAMDKVDLGRAVAGINFSGSSVRMTAQIVNLILSNVVWSNVIDDGINELKDIIKVIDVPQLIWGALMAIYPDGYDLVRPCVAGTDECSELTEVHLNFARLSYTDRRMLRDTHLQHMSNKTKKRTVKELETYQETLKTPLVRNVAISADDGCPGDTFLRFEIPTIGQYENAGHQWVEEVVNSIDTAFGSSLAGGERNTMIKRRAALTELRRYRHWVTGIVYGDGVEEEIDSDPEVIDGVLDSFSSDIDIRKHIINSTMNFIRDTSISAIGIPVYDCPSCERACADEYLNPTRPGLIQLEIQQIFFTLISGKLTAAM